METEIKLAASPAMLDALAVHPALAGSETVHHLVNIWFDTPAGDLHRAGAMLRIRETGQGREQTLKLAARSGLARAEWTAPVTGDQPDLLAFPPKVQRQLARLVGKGALQPIATAKVERRERLVRRHSSQVAVAFDRGTIVAGQASEPICELELELQHGKLHDVLALAGELPLGPELLWSTRSKAARAFALARGKSGLRGQRLPSLDPAMSPAEAFRAIAWAVLGQLLAAYPLVLANGSPEGVHQSRVALRRLRSAIRLFGPVVRDGQMPVLRAALGTAARGLGAARDRYVLVERIARRTADDDADARAVIAHLLEGLAGATADARAILTSAPFQRLLFELALWLETGAWHTGAEAAASRDLRAFAGHALARSRRRLLKRGLDLAALGEEQRHEVRKDAKQLRYAVGFLESLWPEAARGRDKARFAKALGRLQDGLGTLNDIAVATGENQALFADADPITASRLAARLESLLAAESGSARKLMRQAERDLRHIADVRAWWKHG